MKTNLAVFFGCRSVEHEVSIISAIQAINSVNKDKYNVIPVYVAKNGEMYTGDELNRIEGFNNLDKLLKTAKKVTFYKATNNVVMHYVDSRLFSRKKDTVIDVAFPIVHGTNCEDGTIAGYLEFLGLPFVGCDILSAAIGMDKAVFKDVLSAANLPVLPYTKFSAREYQSDKNTLIEKIEKQFPYPVIVKPVNLGSSVGISKADNRASLIDAIDLAVSFADTVLVEKAVENLREINCSVLGDIDNCSASVCEEPIANDEILSYEDKYLSGRKSKGMASLGRKIPADISDELSEEIRTLSCKIFKTLGCNGVVRIDYLFDTVSGKIYANEINTIPGSLAFYLWEATGVKYTELLDRLVSLAFTKQRNRDNLIFTIKTNILSGISFGTKGSKIQ